MNSSKPLRLSQWILFTTIGWLVGIALGIFISSVFESINMPGQFPLALGVGLGVGFMQWLLLRRTSSVTLSWMWMLALGLTIPLLTFDLLSIAFKWKPETYMIAAIALGGWLSGILQYRVCLARIDARAVRWTLYSLSGWFIATLFVFLVFRYTKSLPRTLSVFVAFANLIAGGPILGWITGKFITRFINQPD